MDLYELLKDDQNRDRLLSYGINPVRAEEWLHDKTRAYADPTADAAIAKVMRESNAAPRKRS